jgi:hypothetical protein
VPGEGEKHNRPECYGDVETVFPMGGQGLREVSPGCWDCPHRVECLRAAVTGRPGGRVIAEDRGRREQEHLGGAAGFLRRWSRLKAHSKGMNKP